MKIKKINISASIDPRIKTRFLRYCETNNIKKGGLMEDILTGFLEGRPLTKEAIGQKKEPDMIKEP